jgi:DNA-directed RNA polymerase specialized sigma24 family protein
VTQPKWWDAKDDELDELADFESDDFDLDAGVEEAINALGSDRNSYIGGLWGAYGYEKSGSLDHAMAVVTAHDMVQSFVDTFTRGDTRYRVTFDKKVSTAGTDLRGHAVVITPSPIYDLHLTPQQAGVLLTAMAVHEVSHVRYGRSTAAAVRRVFGDKAAANILSNLLDDVRIERRFADEYPGYRDVFAPMLEYVAVDGRKKHGPVKPKLSDPINLAISAVRYAQWSVWDKATTPERDWWIAWADRWSKEDAPRRHVEGIREALRHIAKYPRQEKRKPKPKPEQTKPDVPLSPEAERFQQRIGTLTRMERLSIRKLGEGKNVEQIADALDSDVDEVKTALRRARQKMSGVRR